MALVLQGRDPVLEKLWAEVPAPLNVYDEGLTAGLPIGAQRYLRHALAPGTPLPSAVRLTMGGTIRLGGAWYPFVAEQVSRWGRGFVWRAASRVRGIPLRGFDRLVDGVGEMRWRLFGLVPIISAAGPDISRSAAARMNAEAIWLPSLLLQREVEVLPGNPGRVEAIARAHGDETRLWLEMDAAGSVRRAGMERWGNPDRIRYRHVPFGGIIEEDRTVGGITIPTRVRMGWFFGTDRFETEGEFFRAEIRSAEFR